MEVRLEYTQPDGKWIVTIDDEDPKEFTNRAYALIYLNNKTLTMVLNTSNSENK